MGQGGGKVGELQCQPVLLVSLVVNKGTTERQDRATGEHVWRRRRSGATAAAAVADGGGGHGAPAGRGA